MRKPPAPRLTREQKEALRIIAEYGLGVPPNRPDGLADRRRGEEIARDRATGMTLRELGQKYGLSGDRVRIILLKNGEEAARLRYFREQMRIAPLEMETRKLPLSIRLRNVLVNDGAVTVGDMTRRREADLLRLPNMGVRTVKELKNFLDWLGLRLADEA